MDNYLYYKYIHSISQFNILPVTSRCNFHCIFCSHNQNPPGLRVFRIDDLKPSELPDIMDFLDGEKKIVIGESATGIIEGEPFLNTSLTDILFILRKKFPSTPVHITTNGSLIDEKILKKLSCIKDLELHISVNVMSEKYRKEILGTKNNIASTLEHLSSYKIPFSASIVALPHVTGWDELEGTVKFLDMAGSEIIKIFCPSFTKYTVENPFCYMNIDELKDFCKHIKSIVNTPVLLEPQPLDNLSAITEGSVKKSPADLAGIREGDEILSIEGYKPESRTDAFKRINSLRNPGITVRRKNEILSFKLIKDKGAKSGLTFLYDIDWSVVKHIEDCLSDDSPVVTSEMAFNIMVKAFEKSDSHVKILPVKNTFFGGNIACAGLLTVDDILLSLKDEKNFNHILLPSIMFDENGFDIKGKSYLDIVNNGCKCDII